MITRDTLQPTRITRSVKVLAWLLLLSHSGIILTGALVRLTGSGLGCPTWPKCTPESWTNTPEMGIHGYIEFGNRMLTFVLVAIAVASVLHFWRLRHERKEIVVLSFVLAAVIPTQAVIGGITVLMELNPWSVGLHFIPSAAAVATATYIVRRTGDSGIRDHTAEGSAGPVLPHLRTVAWLLAVLTAVVVVLGILTTGAGPHSGDVASTRNGFDPEIVSRLHALPVWLLVGCTVLALVVAVRARLSFLARPLLVLLAVEVLQGVIGYTQYFSGLPVPLVAAHMIGVCLTIAAATAVVDATYPRRPLDQDPSVRSLASRSS
ncbi:COX15/CtaA family protein [Brevibacterium litoralis]|uniref:COX15/CtaA family protein n=1 Tax=Brevibacterium litoralis TaxID=3138935 RepID=UPI0032EF1A90